MKFGVLVFLCMAVATLAGELRDQFPAHPRKTTQADFPDPTWYPVRRIQEIGLERTRCYYKCPVYTVIIRNDGTFRYHGEEFTEHRGEWHGEVSFGQLAEVMWYVAEMDYFALSDKYISKDTDLPGAYTMVRTRERKKIIYNYGRVGPAKLDVLQKLIDDLLREAKWERG
jgi:hypothetical protein